MASVNSWFVTRFEEPLYHSPQFIEEWVGNLNQEGRNTAISQLKGLSLDEVSEDRRLALLVYCVCMNAFKTLDLLCASYPEIAGLRDVGGKDPNTNQLQRAPGTLWHWAVNSEPGVEALRKETVRVLLEHISHLLLVKDSDGRIPLVATPREAIPLECVIMIAEKEPRAIYVKNEHERTPDKPDGRTPVEVLKELHEEHVANGEPEAICNAYRDTVLKLQEIGSKALKALKAAKLAFCMGLGSLLYPPIHAPQQKIVPNLGNSPSSSSSAFL